MRVVTVARKPLSEGNVASNVLKYGCGAINIDGSRIKVSEDEPILSTKAQGKESVVRETKKYGKYRGWEAETQSEGQKLGRWPANLILASEEAAQEMDTQSGVSKSSGGRIGNKDGGIIYGGGAGLKGAYTQGDPGLGDVGGASRFFKQVK
jgi:hypothetical protein